MKTHKNISFIAVFLGLTLAGNVLGGIDQWQNKQLFEPSSTLLLAEASGRITIYDGMPIDTIKEAMDKQFNRIDNMMFTGIRHTSPQGIELIEDDGCE